MKTLFALKKWKISTRLVLIGVAFSIPTLLLLLLAVKSVQANIDFASLERLGNEYQRPLERLLELVPRHGELAARVASGETGADSELRAVQSALDTAVDALRAVDARVGSDLQFTADGLAKRKREQANATALASSWAALKGEGAGLASQASAERHAALTATIRTMITHAGDTSNLILDPDLDSYYLMDATLLALPQTQDRIAVISAVVEGLFQRKAVTGAERTQLAIFAALLKEADFDRVTASIQTSLNEDAQFYGVSESLQKRLPEAVKTYSTATDAFLLVLRRLAESEKLEVSREDFRAAAFNARASSFDLWKVAVDELDILLEKRLDTYRAESRRTVGLGLIAFGLTGLLAWWISRGIRASLGHLAVGLGEVGDRVSSTVGNLLDTSRALANSAGSQAASLEQSSASLEEISSMTKINTDNARTTEDLARQTREAADAGALDMNEMTAAMEAIQRSGDSIASIIKIIDEIAFQTNILALNAAVEAARAGEAGQGFAVVADEVRSLAQRSATAARETATQIEDSIVKSRRGSAISAKVATSLSEIVTKARKVDELIQNITKSSLEQTQGIAQINTAVAQIDRITQTTAAEANAGTGIASNLSDQANLLRRFVDELDGLVGGSQVPRTSRSTSSNANTKTRADSSRKGSGIPVRSAGSVSARDRESASF